MKKSQSIEPNGRTPFQSRAMNTVETIFEAAARLLHPTDATDSRRTGSPSAGIGIGARYSYFPNKEAILLAIFEWRFSLRATRVERQVAQEL
jgi:hypothetical protein